MTLGNRIGQYRRKLGMTQEALAQRLDVTNQAVSKWESDQCCPDISLLPKIADIFGITMDELFGRAAPVQQMNVPQPEPEPEPEPDPIPEPDFILVEEPVFEQDPPREEETQYDWKNTFWGSLFQRTIRDFEHRMKDFDEKVKEFDQQVRKDFDSRKASVKERKLPDDIELPWEDDQTLRVALFVGKKLITGHPARKQIEFCYEGPALNIYSECSVTCDGVSGNVWAADDVTCDSVGGSVTAGGDVNCDCVGDYVQTQGDVSCGSVGGHVQTQGDVSCDDVGGNVDAGGDVSCESVHGDVKAGGDVDCTEILGNVTAGGDVSCDEIQGNVHAGGDVDCDHLEGSITASGSVTIG